MQEAAQHADGAMVALYPAPATAKKLAVGGGEKADELHVTLAFLGKADQVDGKKARAAVEAWAKATPKLTGELSGIGHFDVGKDGIVTYRSVDLPDLPTPREKLVKALAAAGTPASTDHGFTPHMTIDYKVRRPAIEKKPISFDAVTLVLGEERENFPLTGNPS
jgi:2'-5' RNA ligase